MVRAFLFAPSDNSFVLQRPKLTSNHRALPLAARAIVIENHPVVCLRQPVGACRIREKGRVVPVAPMCVQNRQPGFVAWIETMRRDLPKLAGRSQFAILAVDVQ